MRITDFLEFCAESLAGRLRLSRKLRRLGLGHENVDFIRFVSRTIITKLKYIVFNFEIKYFINLHRVYFIV